MAETKPTTTPEWNTGAANRTTPNGAKIILGWELDEEPASSFFNWLGHWAGAGLKWIYERFDDGRRAGGGDAEDLDIHPPAPAGAGGNLDIGGADAVSSGAGGAFSAFGGDAATTGAGGAASMTAGTGAGTSWGGDATVSGGVGGSGGADGGDALVLGGDAAGAGAQDGGIAALRGGDGAGTGHGGYVDVTAGAGATTGVGGNATVTGGVGGSSGAVGGNAYFLGGAAAGTDITGGRAEVMGGAARGNGYSKVLIRASDGGQGSGTTLRTQNDYIEVDGENRRIEMKRPVVLEPAAEPTVGLTAGMIYADSTTKKPVCYDGSAFEPLVPQTYALGDAGDTVTATSETAFTKKYTIPAGTLKVGSVIRIRAGGSKTPSNGTCQIRVRIGGISGLSLLTAGSVMATGAYFDVSAEAIVVSLGAPGTANGVGHIITTTDSPGVTVVPAGAIDTTAALDVIVTATMTSGDTATLISLSVDVT